MGAELNQKLFSAADSLRGKMSADQYKDYLLGLIFYKYLSDKLLESTVVKAYKSLDEYNTVAKQTELYKSYILNDKSKAFFIIVFRLVRDVVANHKTTRYAGAAT
ncbi:type I restriction-modification system subunit M N-terminal domain-containing protein, partial [Veillonella fallax]